MTHHRDTEPTSPLTKFFGAPIHTYTRAQAIGDGTLRDITTTAQEAGFRYPVAITAAAWAHAVAWHHGAIQDEDGRLWDVLTMARHGIAHAPTDAQDVTFSVLRVPNAPRAVKPRMTTLVVHVGPGDDAEPVLTIMLPDED